MPVFLRKISNCKNVKPITIVKYLLQDDGLSSVKQWGINDDDVCDLQGETTTIEDREGFSE